MYIFLHLIPSDDGFNKVKNCYKKVDISTILMSMVLIGMKYRWLVIDFVQRYLIFSVIKQTKQEGFYQKTYAMDNHSV